MDNDNLLEFGARLAAWRARMSWFDAEMDRQMRTMAAMNKFLEFELSMTKSMLKILSAWGVR